MIHPTSHCCGCFSLLAGVEIIAFFTLLTSVITICLVSSQNTLFILGFSISPTVQVIAGTWAFLGIPVSLIAGVGMLYRVETAIKIFYYYQICSMAFGLWVPLKFLLVGSLCAMAVDHSVQSMGPSMVCGIMDTFWLLWLGMIGITHAYLAYIVWSAAEFIAENPFPELEKYRQALKHVQHPSLPEKTPVNESRAMPMAGWTQNPPALNGDNASPTDMEYQRPPVFGGMPPQTAFGGPPQGNMPKCPSFPNQLGPGPGGGGGGNSFNSPQYGSFAARPM